MCLWHFIFTVVFNIIPHVTLHCVWVLFNKVLGKKVIEITFFRYASPWYSWNISESGAKQQKLNQIIRYAKCQKIRNQIIERQKWEKEHYWASITYVLYSNYKLLASKFCLNKYSSPVSQVLISHKRDRIFFLKKKSTPVNTGRVYKEIYWII